MTMSLSGMVLSSLGWELLWSTWSVYEPNLNSLSAPVTKIGTATSQIERLWVLRGTQSRRRRGVIFFDDDARDSILMTSRCFSTTSYINTVWLEGHVIGYKQYS